MKIAYQLRPRALDRLFNPANEFSFARPAISVQDFALPRNQGHNRPSHLETGFAPHQQKLLQKSGH